MEVCGKAVEKAAGRVAVEVHHRSVQQPAMVGDKEKRGKTQSRSDRHSEDKKRVRTNQQGKTAYT